MSDQQQNAFAEWRRECEAIEREMNRLISAGRPSSEDERQVRKLQFASLIERREAAARKLMAPTRKLAAAARASGAAASSNP
jgi:hypothetical protein